MGINFVSLITGDSFFDFLGGIAMIFFVLSLLMIFVYEYERLKKKAE
ncbi:MAG: hypothetical protein ACE5KG_07225 [Nitrososphaerales archaeon]